MKTNRLFRLALLSGALLAGSALSSNAAGSYFKFDGGVSLPQDVEIKEIGGLSFPADASQMADLLGISVPGGIAIDKPKFTLDPGFRADLIGGIKLSEPLSLELEIGLIYNPFNSVKVTGSSSGQEFTGEESIDDLNLWQFPMLVNVVYKFLPNSKFHPYLGAGAGGVVTYISGEGDSENDVTFAFQGLAGVDYAFSDNASIGVAYKFLGSLDHEFNDIKTEGIYTHSLMGVFTFNW